MERQTDAKGRQTDAMGRQTDAMGRQTCAEGHMLLLAPETVSELIFICRGIVLFLSEMVWVELILNGDAALFIHFATPHHLAGLFRRSAAP